MTATGIHFVKEISKVIGREDALLLDLRSPWEHVSDFFVFTFYFKLLASQVCKPAGVACFHCPIHNHPCLSLSIIFHVSVPRNLVSENARFFDLILFDFIRDHQPSCLSAWLLFAVKHSLGNPQWVHLFRWGPITVPQMQLLQQLADFSCLRSVSLEGGLVCRGQIFN